MSQRLYRLLIEAIDRCDAVVAILDGPDSDSGTCVEIGYAAGESKPIIGVRTDFRDGDIHGIERHERRRLLGDHQAAFDRLPHRGSGGKGR